MRRQVMGLPEMTLLLVLLVATALALPSSSELPKPSYARTMLKVSRSLPGETEELKVRTSEGNLATLIVKRREKSVPSDSPAPLPNVDQTPSPSPSPSSSSNSSSPSSNTTAEPVTTTIGYQNVEVDPWNRLQTWSSVSEARKQPQAQSQEEDSRSWVPVSRNSDSWKPLVAGARGFQSLPAEGDEQVVRYAFLPHEPRPRTNIGANLLKNRDAKNVPAEVVVRSEINVKPQPGQQQVQAKRLPVTLDADGTPVVHGRRVPDEPIDKIQVWRNARVINDQLVTDSVAPTAAATTARGLTEPQNFERFFEDVNRRYGKTPEENLVNGRTYRNEALAAEIYEAAEEEGYRPSIRKRMLQPEVPTAVYPNSRIYSPPDTPKPVVKPGTRAPVLQYAHPELGVQPAKVVKSEKRTRPEEAVPFSEMNAPPKPTSYSYGEHRQKKKYVLNDKNIVDSYTYKNYYPNQHFYGLKRPEAPFWVRVSENIKSQFTDGVNKVSELTKPVFDPLVEATRKISENLGLSRSQDPAQDKVGSVATSGSVLIPALGLVASGAALGIGAVAVGRYLDVDVLKRSNEQGDDEEATRALRILPMLEEGQRMTPAQDETLANSNGMYILLQDDRTVTRRKRSNVDDDARRMQRKGADSIAEIVEIDVPALEASENELRLDNEEALAQAIVEQTIEAIAGAQNREDEPRIRRRRDAELDDALQNLENAEVSEAAHIPGDWSNTPCAKRIFCDAMLQRGSDARVFMEKKMAGLLRMIQPGAAVQVSSHFDEVMDAVRRHDCSIFSCPQARPASVFF